MVIKKILFFLSLILLSDVLFGQKYFQYGKNITNALNKLENKYVFAVFKDSSVAAGKLYILNSVGGKYYVVSSRNDVKKVKFYSDDILDVGLIEKQPGVSMEQLVIEIEKRSASDFYNLAKQQPPPEPTLQQFNPSLNQKNIYENDDDEEETYKGFNKAIYTYTAWPMKNRIYAYVNIPNGVQGGVKLLKNFEIESGISTVSFYNGYANYFIQPKFVSNFNSNFNLSYIININGSFKNLIRYNQNQEDFFHLINLTIGDEKFWVNMGIGSMIKYSKNAIYSLSGSVRLFKDIYVIGETFKAYNQSNHNGINIRYATRYAHFDIGYTYGNYFENRSYYEPFSTVVSYRKFEQSLRYINIGVVINVLSNAD
ncbi:MAG: hypothetical protein ACK4K9_05910 [Bacteroidia bacterium]